jgi:hypothetical protein
MFESIKKFWDQEGKVEQKPQWEEEALEGESTVTPEQINKALNIFMAGRGIVIGPEFVNLVIEKARLTKTEIDDIVAASFNVMPENGLPIAANLVYMDTLRDKIERVIGVGPDKIDVNRNI